MEMVEHPRDAPRNKTSNAPDIKLLPLLMVVPWLK
jgi:hypothetical protein